QETGAPTDRSCSQKGSTITPSRLPQEPLTEDLTSASTPCPAPSTPPPMRLPHFGDSTTASFPTSLSASTMTHQHELGKSPTRMPRVVASQCAPQFSQLVPRISSRLTA